MASSSLDLIKVDEWHEYFDRKGLDEFELIENAILVAGWYRPDEFLERRAHLAEILFAKINPLPRRLRRKDNTSTAATATTTATYDDTNPNLLSDLERKVDINIPSSSRTDKVPIHVQTSTCSEEGPNTHDHHTTTFPSSSSSSRRRHGKGKGYLCSPDGKYSTADLDKLLSISTRKEFEEVPAATETRINGASKLVEDYDVPDTTPTTTTTSRKLEDIVPAPVCNTKNEKLDDAAFEMKLAASKRKMDEQYKQYHNGRKRIKTIDFKDLPQHHQAVANNHTRRKLVMI